MSAKLVYGYCLLCGVYCFTSVAENRFNAYRDRGSQADVSQMREIPSSSTSSDQSSSLSPEEIYSGTESDDAKTYIYLCRSLKGGKCCCVSKAGLHISAIRVASKGEFGTFSRETSRNIIWSASAKFGCKEATIRGGDLSFRYYNRGRELDDNEDFFHDKNGNPILKEGARTDDRQLGIESILETALFRWKTNSIRTLTDFFRSVSMVGKDRRVKGIINGREEEVKVLPGYDLASCFGYNCAMFAEEALFHLLGQDSRKSKWKWIGSALGAVAGTASYFIPWGSVAYKVISSSVGGGVFGFVGGYAGAGKDNAPESIANRILSDMKKEYENADEEGKRKLEESFKIIVYTEEEVLESLARKRAGGQSPIYRQRSRTLANVRKNTKLKTKNVRDKGDGGETDESKIVPVTVFLDTDFEPMAEIGGLELDDQDNNTEFKPAARFNLIWAAKNGYESTVSVLLDDGADPNTQNGLGETSLMWAAKEGYSDIVRILLNKGADPNIRDNRGRTALMWAVMG